MKTLDNHEVRLRALFRAIGRVAGVSAVVAAAGCASDGSAVAGDPDVPGSLPPLWDPADFEPVCTDGVPNLLDDDALVGADGVRVYYLADGNTLLASAGAFCVGADETSCENEVTEATRDGGGVVVVLTKKDGVLSLHRGADEVRAWVGVPDSSSDALLISKALGVRSYCPSSEGDSPTGVREAGDGWEVLGTTTDSCQSSVWETLVYVPREGEPVKTVGTLIAHTPGCAGRRPEGLIPSLSGTLDAGGFLAALAQLEAVSVPAFLELARDLEALGAPPSLVAGAHRAANDEVKHAATMAALAASHGAPLAKAAVRPTAPRGLLALALDNAEEGCIRETWGALLAHQQAETARDPAVRAAFRTIADDETRHAALAWAIADWAKAMLDEPGRRAVADARTRALSALAPAAIPELAAEARATLGLPDDIRGAALWRGFVASLS